MQAYKLKNIQLTVTVAVMVIIIFILLNGLSDYTSRYDAHELDRLEDVIEKYAIQCYATEGAYPPSLAYLEEHYGLILDTDQYIYEYEPVAENIKPSIRVINKLGE